MTAIGGSGERAGVARTRHRPIIRALSSGAPPIWLLSAAMAAGAAALLTFGGVGALQPPPSSMRLPVWALAIGFALAEHLVVHVHFRRSSHSMALGEIPLVFALLYAGGWTVVIAYTVGRAFALLVLRLPPIRLAFNAAQFALGGCLAVLTFHAAAGGTGTSDPRTWLAVALAATLASACAVLMITAAVSFSEGRLSVERIVASLRTDLIVTLANTSLGLCAAGLVEQDWRTAVLLVVPIAGMFLTMRAYAAERARHDRLEFLYDAARALSGSAGTGEALARMLTRSLEAFRSEAAEIIVFSPDGEEALRTSVRADGETTLLEPLGAETTGLRAATSGAPVACLAREVSDPFLRDYLRSRGLGDGVFATLQGEHACVGVIALGDPAGVVARFGPDDVKLCETLAANTSVALENDRLGHAVWELQELQSELEHQASHDPLTGLANRSLFARRLDDALSRAAEGTAVIFIDVNDFKMVNDTLGHAAGDELLVAISGRLGDCVRPTDTLARLGGDEFAILLQDGATQAQAIEIAERIDRRMEERFSIAGELHLVRVSIGIAVGDPAPAQMSSEELIRNADLAMYRAKQAKHAGYQLFESGMEVSVLHQHGLRRRLREASQRDAFAVHYQPIVDLNSGAVTAQEALVRWVDAPRGTIGPSAFISVAEELGVIVPIGRRVLHRACREAQTWSGEGGPAPAVHVNVSPIELRDERFLPGVHSALAQSGLDPHRLVLEITESVLLSDPARCVAILQQLRGLGVQIALDDFGTGYSSLSQLRGLPLDWLKLGRPFVDDIEPHGTSRPFVRMIIALAASLGVRVVAEEIEDRRQMQLLRALGCGYGQGFYLGEPAPGSVEPVPAPVGTAERVRVTSA
ncbi:MAG TPA: EAL domain-containing protein [Solirubrobacteraceae bacterium]|nr:EAL domain-containing protein [Solirubrobacteraceae bacterium]